MIQSKVKTIFFFSIITCFTVLTLVLPKKDKSEIENRTLEPMPTLTIDSIFDKSFMTDFESFLSDHFFGRTSFVKSKTFLELAQGKSEVNGVYISSDRLVEKIDTPSPKIIEKSTNAINEFALKHKDILNTSLMLIPTVGEIYPQSLPYFSDNLNQSIFIRDFYATLRNVSCVDVVSSLKNESSKYIYYRTDHHWTSYGAYIGYKTMSSSLGFRPATVDLFNIEHASYDFLGTLYSKVIMGEHLSDVIDIYSFAKSEPVSEVIRYKYDAVKNDVIPTSSSTIYEREYLDSKNKYGVYLGENEAVIRIKTNVGNGKKAILFKDSFSHTLMQFLPIHFEEVALVDLRYLNRPLEQYLNISDYDEALFIYNMAGFMKDDTISKVTTI